MKLRLTPAQLALSYVALGALALALLAIPHWDGFHASEGDFREYVIQAVLILAALGFVFAWLLRLAHRHLEEALLRDAAERMRAERALRLSEERYSLAMDASEEAHFDHDVRTGELFVSERLNEIYGIPAGTQLARRDEYLKGVRLHPDDVAKYHGTIDAAIAPGGPARYEFEFRVLRPSGEVGWFRTRGVVMRDAAGRALRRTGVVADITESKLAEQALRRSEQSYALAMEAAQDGHWDCDLLTGRYYLSPNSVQIYGLPEITKATTRAEFFAIAPFVEEDLESWRHATAELFAGTGDRLSMEMRANVRGEMRWILVNGLCVRDAAGNPSRWCGSARDVTERKRVLDELRTSEARFRALTELSSDWYWRQDEQLRFTYLSTDIDGLQGYPGGSAVGRARWELHDITPLSCTWEEHRAVLEARKPFRDLEYSRPARPGSTDVRYISVSGAPVIDDHGVFRGYHGVGRDITDRKRAEAKLRASEARFRALNELSSDWYWRQDENLRFTYLSTDIDRVDGLAGQSAIGKTRWELDITPVSCSWDEHRAVLDARKPFRDMEYSRQLGNGRFQYVAISGAPEFDEKGAFRGYQGVGRDITGRKRGEAKLRESEARFRALIELSSDWYWEQDRDLRFTYISDQVTRNRFALEKVIGLKRRELAGVTPLTSDWDEHDAVLAGRQPFRDFEYMYEGPDGHKQYASISGAPVFDAEGVFCGYQGVGRNINYRKAAEEELRAMERKLRQAQRLEAIGTLAGGIAHDFNNILGAILGYGEMAMRDAATGTRLRRDLDSIMAAGERGRALVDRVLAFSRSGVGERVPVHVEQVVREALDLLSAKLQPDITLHARLQARNAAIRGDATQVHQVLMNLVINAAQAMAGGGVLRVSLRAERIDHVHVPTIGSVAVGDYLVLEVADTGSGIPADIFDRIFDPFFTTKEVGTGTGLGLSLVHGIVTELGGAINVASAVGAGTTFTVYFPRTGDVEEADLGVEHELPRGDGQRVLVVDDEEPLVALATRTLEELGYAAVGFTSSSAALAAFRADPQRFDAVITDERMPGMAGSALIREVRGIREHIPIVLMSGYVGGAIASRAREAGAEEVLRKPLSARDLATSLARVLNA